MDSNLNLPVEGECIGRRTFLDTCQATLHQIMILLSIGFFVVSYYTFDDIFNLDKSKFYVVLLSLLYALSITFIYLVVYYFFFKRALWKSIVSKQLIWQKDGVSLGGYKVKKISNLSLDENTLSFTCKFERPKFLNSTTIQSCDFEFKVSRRFREKPFLLLEFINTHDRNLHK